MDKNEFRIISAASPCVAGRRSSGRSGGVAAGAVVDNEVHLDLVFYSLVHDLNGILGHLPGQDTVLVKELFNLVNNVPDPPATIY